MAFWEWMNELVNGAHLSYRRASRAVKWHRIAMLASECSASESSGRSLDGLGSWPDIIDRLNKIEGLVKQLREDNK